MIDQKTFDRGKKSAIKDAGFEDNKPKFASAVEVGSKEGYSAILAATTGRANNGLEETAKKQAALQGAGNGILSQILAALRGTPAQVEYTV